MRDLSEEQAVEARLRRTARRQGLMLRKSRRVHNAPAPYFVIDPYINALMSSEYGMNLDEIEAYFRAE